MQRSAVSEGVKGMVVDKWVIRQAEEPTKVCNTLLLKKQQIESSEPETIAGWPERVKNTVWWMAGFIELWRGRLWMDGPESGQIDMDWRHDYLNARSWWMSAGIDAQMFKYMDR